MEGRETRCFLRVVIHSCKLSWVSKLPAHLWMSVTEAITFWAGQYVTLLVLCKLTAAGKDRECLYRTRHAESSRKKNFSIVFNPWRNHCWFLNRIERGEVGEKVKEVMFQISLWGWVPAAYGLSTLLRSLAASWKLSARCLVRKSLSVKIGAFGFWLCVLFAGLF